MRINDKFKARFLAILINVVIFSFLPVLHHLFHKPPSEIRPIDIDLAKVEPERKISREKPKEENVKKLTKPKWKLKSEFRRRIAFELQPGLLAGEVDLIAPEVTYDLSEVDQLPRLIEYEEPSYPEKAIMEEIEGNVLLKILIDREGRVIMVKVLDNGGFYEFAQAAIRAVKRWRFEPAKIMGIPVTVWCMQPVRFELN